MTSTVRVASAADVELVVPLFDAYRQFYGLTSDVPLARRFLTMFDNLPTSRPHVRAGKLRGLAVTSASRSSLRPNCPRSRNQACAATIVTGWVGMLAPAQAPADILSKLHTDVSNVLATPEAKERFLSQGAEAATSTPQQFTAFLRAEIEKWASVVKKAGITTQ